MKKVKKIPHFFISHKKISLLLIVILLLAFFLRPKAKIALETVTIKPTTFTQTISATGDIESDNTSTVSFLTGGTVTFVGAKKGDHVNQYQTLATLDQRTVEKNLDTALQTYAEQRNTFDQTIANNNNIQNPLNAPSDTIRRILQDNQYDLNKAVNSVELQSLIKEQSVLTSPIAGIITRADIKNPGEDALPTSEFVITDDKHMHFAIDVDEADIGKISNGIPVEITLDAFPNAPLKLPITNIDFTSHTTTTGGNAYTVSVELPDNTNGFYRVGMNGDADIILREEHNVLSVPTSSIVDNTYVFVKTAQGYEKRKISEGLQNDTDTVVTGGLTAGEQVVLQGSDVPVPKQSSLPF